MDDKKIQKALDIMLQQQAITHSEGQETKEKQKEHEKRIHTIERAAINLYNITVEQGKNIKEISASIVELRDVQKETNERLNDVIFMAEKFFSGQNGKSKK